jgi:xanthine dehydrogenase small subunit
LIQFILNNKIIKPDKNSGITLLNFIREYEYLKETKFVVEKEPLAPAAF